MRYTTWQIVSAIERNHWLLSGSMVLLGSNLHVVLGASDVSRSCTLSIHRCSIECKRSANRMFQADCNSRSWNWRDYHYSCDTDAEKVRCSNIVCLSAPLPSEPTGLFVIACADSCRMGHDWASNLADPSSERLFGCRVPGGIGTPGVNAGRR